MNAEAPDTRSLPKIAAEHMGKRLLDTVLQELRVAQDTWQKMSEKQQADTIERARKSITYAVAGAVNTIATADSPALVAEIDGAQIKDKIKLTLLVDRANSSENLNHLYDSGSGSKVQILLASAEQYIGGMELVSAEPDQPDLLNVATVALPDDELLWAINAPVASNKQGNLFPTPTRQQAEDYARSIRAKLLEINEGWALTLAKRVYACPWPQVKGEHTRSIERGDWQALVDWFGDLLRGDPVPEQPVAMIEHVPEEVQAEVVQPEPTAAASEPDPADESEQAKADLKKMIRYRNPANPSETWSGRGKKPRWMELAMQDGMKLEDFLADQDPKKAVTEEADEQPTYMQLHIRLRKCETLQDVADVEHLSRLLSDQDRETLSDEIKRMREMMTSHKAPDSDLPL